VRSWVPQVRSARTAAWAGVSVSSPGMGGTVAHPRRGRTVVPRSVRAYCLTRTDGHRLGFPPSFGQSLLRAAVADCVDGAMLALARAEAG
jgi:hypothetical protein